MGPVEEAASQRASNEEWGRFVFYPETGETSFVGWRRENNKDSFTRTRGTWTNIIDTPVMAAAKDPSGIIITYIHWDILKMFIEEGVTTS